MGGCRSRGRSLLCLAGRLRRQAEKGGGAGRAAPATVSVNSSVKTLESLPLQGLRRFASANFRFRCDDPFTAMRDAITGLIGRYDQLGRYLDRSAIDRIDIYYAESALRLAAVELINGEAATIVREASQQLWLEDPELILPGGNAYTTRRLAACLRDLDYFLRYASYALIADDVTILDERVLNGLDDTYKSLGVPTGPTVRGIALLGDVVAQRLVAAGIADSDRVKAVVLAPFDHLVRGLASTNVRAR